MHPSTPNIPPIWDGDDDCNVFVRGVIDVWVWLLFVHERSRSGICAKLKTILDNSGVGQLQRLLTIPLVLSLHELRSDFLYSIGAIQIYL
jgi:hypothetical protein